MKTRRERIIELLKAEEDGSMTLQELADLLQTSVKTIVEDLNSVRKSLKREGIFHIQVSPASCFQCEYLFPSKRSRIADPSKCPKCHSERIRAQGFRIVGT